MDDASSTLGPDVKAALDRLNQLCRDVLSDQLTVNRRTAQVNEVLAGYAELRADCAVIKAALAAAGGKSERSA